MSFCDLEKMSDAELLRHVLTGGNAGTGGELRNESDTIEAIHAAADDLNGLWQAVTSEKDLVDLGGVITRVQMRLEVAAELARRDYEAKRAAPNPRRVVPIKRSDPGPFAGEPTS